MNSSQIKGTHKRDPDKRGFSWHAKNGEEEKPLNKSCQNPVEHAQRMTQCNFRTNLEPSLFSGHFDKAGTVLASRYAHSSCARMTRWAKTGYTTSLTSVTSPNSWTTYRVINEVIYSRLSGYE